MIELDAISMLTAQVASLTKQLQQNNLTAQAMQLQSVCEMCGMTHPPNKCPAMDLNNFPMEQVQAIGNSQRPANNPYSMFYNQGWQNHPNLSWKNNQGEQPPYPQNHPQYPPHQSIYGLNPRPYYDPRQAMPQHPPLHPQVNPPEVQSDTLN